MYCRRCTRDPRCFSHSWKITVRAESNNVESTKNMPRAARLTSDCRMRKTTTQVKIAISTSPIADMIRPKSRTILAMDGVR